MDVFCLISIDFVERVENYIYGGVCYFKSWGFSVLLLVVVFVVVSVVRYG